MNAEVREILRDSKSLEEAERRLTEAGYTQWAKWVTLLVPPSASSAR